MQYVNKIYGIISALILVAGLSLSLGTTAYANSENLHSQGHDNKVEHSDHSNKSAHDASSDLVSDSDANAATVQGVVTDKSGGQDSDSTHPGWVTEEKHESATAELHECESHGQGPVCSKGHEKVTNTGGENTTHNGGSTENVGGNPATTTPAVLGSSATTLPDTGPETSTVLGLLGTFGLGGILRFGGKIVAKIA